MDPLAISACVNEWVFIVSVCATEAMSICVVLVVACDSGLCLGAMKGVGLCAFN